MTTAALLTAGGNAAGGAGKAASGAAALIPALFGSDQSGTTESVVDMSAFAEQIARQSSSGTATSQKGTTESAKGRGTKQLELDEEAVAKMIEDLLSVGEGGLASIFAGEQNAGVFNSSVAAQASGNLAAKIVGELAKVTGREVTSQDQMQLGREGISQSQLNQSLGIETTNQTQHQESQGRTSASSGGLFDSLGLGTVLDGVGDVFDSINPF